jgi:glucosamine kinase
MSGHVVGVDAGGTTTRALAVDAAGNILGSGRAGGANPNSHPPEQAAAAVADALGQALSGLDPADTRACVVGLAGASKLNDPSVAALFDRAWHRVGLPGGARVVTDALTAFSSATSAADGTVLVAGTGSIAGRVRGNTLTTVSGGYGWLLGDEGSGFWIGREAVRTTLAALYAGRPLGLLCRAVLEQALGADGESGTGMRAAHRLITAVKAAPPVELARFAPLVSAADQDGDPQARAIDEQAAQHLVDIALAVRDPGEETPFVLVGSVLGDGSPVSRLVRDKLARLPVLRSTDGVLGAAWLAAVDAYGSAAVRPSAEPVNS